MYVTAKELSTSSSLSYRFVFKNDDEEKERQIILTDTSDYPTRYNLFTFTEGTDLTLMSGQNEYRIYDNNNVEVEVGKALVVNAEDAADYYYSATSINNYVNS